MGPSPEPGDSWLRAVTLPRKPALQQPPPALVPKIELLLWSLSPDVPRARIDHHWIRWLQDRPGLRRTEYPPVRCCVVETLLWDTSIYTATS